MVTLSSATTLFYLYFFLQDEIGLVRDDATSLANGLRVSEGVLILTGAYAMSVFTTVVVAGVLTSVDFALVSQVLPTATNNGKNIGIINLAIALSNVLSPLVAAFMVNHLGGYTGLCLLSGGLSVLGGVLVYCIKSVK